MKFGVVKELIMKKLFLPAKEILFIVFVAVLPIFIFGFSIIGWSFRVAKNSAEQENRIYTKNFASQIQLYLERAKETIEALANFSFEKIDQQTLQAVYEKNTFRGIPLFESLTLLDKEGKIKAVYPFKKELLDLDYSRQPSFLFVSKEKKTFFSKVDFSLIGQQPVVKIAAPIFEKEREKSLKGMIEGSVRLQALSLFLEGFSLERRSGEAFLIGEKGEIIAHQNYQYVREQENIHHLYPELAEIILKIEKGEGKFQYRDFEKTEYLVIFQTIPKTNWKLVTKQNVKEILAPVYQLSKTLTIFLVLSIFGAATLDYRVASYVNSLQEKAQKEKLEALEEAKKVLEIKVQARTRELKELVEQQEEIIKERTKELQKKVEELEKFYRLTIGRELKMIELKKEIKRLKELCQKSQKT